MRSNLRKVCELVFQMDCWSQAQVLMEAHPQSECFGRCLKHAPNLQLHLDSYFYVSPWKNRRFFWSCGTWALLENKIFALLFTFVPSYFSSTFASVVDNWRNEENKGYHTHLLATKIKNDWKRCCGWRSVVHLFGIVRSPHLTTLMIEQVDYP